MMARFYHHLLPLYPPPTEAERAEVACKAVTLVKNRDGAEVRISLLGRSHTVDAIAVSMNTDVGEAEKARLVRRAGNAVLSALRIAYDPATDVIRLGTHSLNASYEDDVEEPKYTFLAKTTIDTAHVVSYDAISATFSAMASNQLEPVLSLIGEAALPALPAHYRVLSLYRAMELLTSKEELDEWCDEFQPAFADLKMSERAFRNAMPEIRNRCAHGAGRGRGNPAPLVAQVYPELDEISGLADLLRRMVFEMLRRKHSIDFRPL